MIVYEVTATIDATLADKFENYMREKHIADVLASGAFTGAEFETSEKGRYRTRYIADTLNNRIRVVDMVTWTIDTLAGDGSEGGPETGDALTSGLYWPRDIAVGPDGSVYVADSENHCVRRIFDGEIETVAGICGEPGMGKDNRLGTDSNLVRPLGLDVGPDGAVWIADSWTHRIRRVAPLE